MEDEIKIAIQTLPSAFCVPNLHIMQGQICMYTALDIWFLPIRDKKWNKQKFKNTFYRIAKNEKVIICKIYTDNKRENFIKIFTYYRSYIIVHFSVILLYSFYAPLNALKCIAMPSIARYEPKSKVNWCDVKG